MTTPSGFSLLESINNPSQLRDLSEDRLPALAKELREFLVKSVSQTGGHLSAGLGTIELTIAKHTMMQQLNS